ncbi:MAG: HAMP domain-containing sensor histidine kinase [Bacteroidales bacterium]|nr:HAMP domain-containing sensor histidine kinase [Bacteroidales bacterium]
MINLKDITESTKEEMPFAFQLFDLSLKNKDKFGIMVALGSVTSYFMEQEAGKDSLFIFLKKADNLLKGSPYDGMVTYYNMCYYMRLIQLTKRENIPVVCDSILNELNKNAHKESKFEEVERLFINGVISHQLASLSGNNSWKSSQAYFEEGWKKIDAFPLTAKKYFSANFAITLLTTYSITKDDVLFRKTADTYLEIQDRFFEQPEIINRRPYFHKNLSYLLCYERLIFNSRLIGKDKAHEYYLKYRDFINSGSGDELYKDKSFFYNLSTTYFKDIEDYNQAILFEDSLIYLIENNKTNIANISNHYLIRALLLSKAARYKESCEAYEVAVAKSDSLMENEYMEKVGEMRVKYDVEKLEHEKVALLAAKRTNELRFAGVIIVITLIISLYLFFNLRRVRGLQVNLEHQQKIAQDSEKIKTSFINSMCHEIRTPLNAINGFSELITEDSVSDEEKNEFSTIIKENVFTLTRLINDMLEVANLDSTSTELPMEIVDIPAICEREVKRLTENSAKRGITYNLEMPKDECKIYTHPHYFSLMLRALLDNANKFTDKGSITVSCRRDSEEFIVSIKDTGCGIPDGKRDYVFEKFAKVNAFTQGNGLGLYLCRLVAERLKGRIEFDPDYHKGLKVNFIIKDI